jgi:hypothetical protein
MSSDDLKLFFVKVYMPYEGGDVMTITTFAGELSSVESLLNINDCHVIIGGDFQIYLFRDWLHTAIAFATAWDLV